jgi:hypothetical protein
MIDLLRPSAELRPRGVPEDPLKLLYVRSYLMLRLGIGMLGLALPIGMWLMDSFLSRHWQGRGSISNYYYSGAREAFVGPLCAIAVFLVAHKVGEGNLDNLLTIGAGLFAAIVALCPTGRPSSDIPLSPLQSRLGESLIQGVHYTAAILFLACLGGMCWMFGNVEGRRPPKTGKRSPQFWRHFHHGCAATIGLGLVLCLISLLTKWPRLFWPEALCVWAFGLSWTMKGAELDILKARVVPASNPSPDP